MSENPKNEKYLTDKEISVVKALLPEGAILWYSNKAMTHLIHPGKDSEFIELGRELVDSLNEKKILQLIEQGLLAGETYIFSPKGRKVAERLNTH